MTEQTTHFNGDDTDISLEHWVMDLPAEEAGCETVHGPCSNSATWWCMRPLCGCGAAVCDAHKTLWVAKHAAYAGEEGFCGKCLGHLIYGQIRVYPI